MIFPREEKLKYEKLQAKLDRLSDSCEKMDIFTHYNTKFETIVLCASQKMVRRTDKVLLNPNEAAYSGTKFTITGSGIRQNFGYQGNHRRPEGNWVHPFVSGHGYGTEIKKNLATLMRGLDRVKKLSKSPERVDELKQIFEDIRVTGFYGRYNDTNLSHSEKITLGSHIEIQGTEEISESAKGNDASRSCKATRAEVALRDDSINITLLEKKKGQSNLFQIGSNLQLSDYLRISEPATYDVVTKLVDDLIIKVDAKVGTKTKELDAVVQKYGQYICYKEL